jgi:hypothetical protein
MYPAIGSPRIVIRRVNEDLEPECAGQLVGLFVGTDAVAMMELGRQIFDKAMTQE